MAQSAWRSEGSRLRASWQEMHVDDKKGDQPAEPPPEAGWVKPGEAEEHRAAALRYSKISSRMRRHPR